MIPVPAAPERNIKNAAENKRNGCRFYPAAVFERILKKTTYEIRSEIAG